MRNPKIQKLGLIFKERLTNAELTSTSVLIAYYLLLSIFPLMMILGNLLPLFRLNPQNVLVHLDAIVPQAVMPVLEPLVDDLLSHTSNSLLSIGAIGLLWSASLVINHLQKGINKAYGIPDANVIAKRILALITILMIILFLVAFLLLFSFGEILLTVLTPTLPRAAGLLNYIFRLKWPLAFVFLFILLMLIYRVVPNVKNTFREVIPGTLFSTIGMLLLVQAFTIYIHFSTRALFGYSTLGGFFLLMFWLHFTGAILILGAVINASLSEYKKGPAKPHVDALDLVITRTKNRLEFRFSHLLERFTKHTDLKNDAPQDESSIEPEPSCEGENGTTCPSAAAADPPANDDAENPTVAPPATSGQPEPVSKKDSAEPLQSGATAESTTPKN